MAHKMVSEAHAYRLGLLSERAAGLERQMGATIAESQQIMAGYGLTGQEVRVVTEPGMQHPVGTVLDAKTGQPLSLESSQTKTTRARKPKDATETAGATDPKTTEETTTDAPVNGVVQQESDEATHAEAGP